MIRPRNATVDEVLTKHTREQYDLLRSTSQSEDTEHLEELSSHYDAIYVHPVRSTQSTYHLKIIW